MRLKPKMMTVAVYYACQRIGMEWRVANGLAYAS
jgi:hypothetical protein